MAAKVDTETELELEAAAAPEPAIVDEPKVEELLVGTSTDLPAELVMELV